MLRVPDGMGVPRPKHGSAKSNGTIEDRPAGGRNGRPPAALRDAGTWKGHTGRKLTPKAKITNDQSMATKL